MLEGGYLLDYVEIVIPAVERRVTEYYAEAFAEAVAEVWSDIDAEIKPELIARMRDDSS